MSATLTFDAANPKRSDFRLILKAVKEQWPIDANVRESLVTFCMQTKLTGRSDRLVNLAIEALNALEAAKCGDVA